MKRTSSLPGFWARVCLTCGALVFAVTAFGDTVAIWPAAQTSSSRLTASESGSASYYGAKYHGRQTASGEVFNMNDFTAAHPKLAFGTRVRVTHLESNRAVIVRINDRGPFVKGRIIDLSQAAAEQLQMIRSGIAQVKLEVLE